jgi:hypothetical protein
MALRVVGLKDHPASLTEEDFPSEYSSSGQGRSFMESPATCTEKMAAAGLGSGCIVLLLCGIALALYVFVIKGDKSIQRQKSVRFSSSIVENGGLSHLSLRQMQLPPGNPQRFVATPPQHGFNPNGVSSVLPPPPSTTNKPLPPPPSHQSQASPPTEPDHLSKSELSTVAKMLHKLAESKNNKRCQKQEQTDYECIDETSSTGDNSSSATSTSSKKSDKNGVYIVYCCKDDKGKGKRPKSAPASLREKRRMGSKKAKNRKQLNEEIYGNPTEVTSDSLGSESQTEVTESDDSLYDENNNPRGSAVRRTVRNVKSRSHRYTNDSQHSRSVSERKQNKVVSGIRRRLSSFYKDSKMQQQFKGAGSFHGRQKLRGSTKVEGGRKTEMMSSDGTIMSSDLDSAYYGSEFNDDVLMEMRQLATQHQCQSMQVHNNYPSSNGQYSQQQQQRIGLPPLRQDMLQSVKMQLRNPSGGVGNGDNFGGTSSGNHQVGLASPPLEPGQTKAAHFVTRNDSSTQILIVPETHV